MEIIVSFITKTNHQENFILTMGIDVYPSYMAGDKIFLQITNTDDPSKQMKLSEYKIIDVVHSVREHTTKNNRKPDNILGITNFLGMEVYVKEMP